MSVRQWLFNKPTGKRKKFRTLVVLSVSIGLVGCSHPFSGCDPDCLPPEYAYNELLEFGVTLAPHTRGETVPTPELVETNTYDYLNSILRLTFLPADEFRHIEDPTSYLGLSRVQTAYKHVFSIENSDGSSTAIEAGDNLDEQTPYRDVLVFGGGGVDFRVFFNQDEASSWSHDLQTPASTKVPVAATHIELWLRGSDESEFGLIRRVPLQSFFAYRTYLLPTVQLQ